MRKRKPTHEEMLRTIIDKMFEIAGHNVTFDDIKDRQDNWYQQWTMTTKQNEEWVEWMREYLKTEVRWPKWKIEKEVMWIPLMYGLKFSDYESANL